MCDPKFKCDPETKQTANQIKHVVGAQMSSEPAGYFPWPNQRVHQWGNTADFIIYSLPGQLDGEPKLGKSPELMDSLNWSARKVKVWFRHFPQPWDSQSGTCYMCLIAANCGVVAVTIVTRWCWLVVVQIFRSEAKPVRMVWKFLFCNILMFR